MKDFIETEFVQYFTEQIMIILEQTNFSDIEIYDDNYKVPYPVNSSKATVIDLVKSDVDKENNNTISIIDKSNIKLSKTSSSSSSSHQR